MIDQGIDGLIFEKEGTADIAEYLTQGIRQLHDDDGIDAIFFQSLGRVDLTARDLEGFTNQFLDICRTLHPQQISCYWSWLRLLWLLGNGGCYGFFCNRSLRQPVYLCGLVFLPYHAVTFGYNYLLP